MAINSQANICGICDAATANGYICTRCTIGLYELLTRIGVTENSAYHRSVLCMLDELDVQMSRQSRAAPRYGGRSAETPIPFDSRAAKAHSALCALLTGWARHYGAPDYVLSGPRRCADWLRNCLTSLVRMPDIERMHAELSKASAYADTLIDQPEAKDYIGICSSVIGGVFCNVDLYAAQGATSLVCRNCGIVHDVGGRRKTMLNAADEVLLNGVDIARIAQVMGVTNITAGGIYKWKFRGRLMVRGISAEGYPMYRLGDVLELARGRVLHSVRMEDSM